MRRFTRFGLLVGLTFQPHLPAGAATVDPVSVPVYTPRASGSLDGIWEGAVGDQSVMACFDGSIGSYYRVQDKKSIWLWAESDLQFAETDERNPKNPRWRVTVRGTDRIVGQRVDGGSMQPLRLQRVPIVERQVTDDSTSEAGCSSMSYLGKRIEPLSVSEEPMRVGGVNVIRIIAKPPHNPEDFEYRTFRLSGKGPALNAVNERLASFIDMRGPGESEWSECLLGAGNAGGTFYRALDPIRIGRRFVVANEHREGSCGGPHPFSAIYPRIFDLISGMEIKISDWLLPRALDRKTVETIGSIEFDVEPNLLPLSSALVRQILKRSGRMKDKECSDALADVSFWTVGIGRNSFVFTPSLGHAVQACGDVVEVPFKIVAPYLNDEGKRAVEALRSEPAELAPGP